MSFLPAQSRPADHPTVGPDLNLDQGRLVHPDRRVGFPATRTSARSGRRTALLNAFLQSGTRRAAVAGSAATLAREGGRCAASPAARSSAPQRLRRHRPGRTQLRKLRLLRPRPGTATPSPSAAAGRSPSSAGRARPPATRPRQSLAQSDVRRRQRHRPRRLRRVQQADLQPVLLRLGPPQRIPQPPNVVRQRQDPVGPTRMASSSLWLSALAPCRPRRSQPRASVPVGARRPDRGPERLPLRAHRQQRRALRRFAVYLTVPGPDYTVPLGDVNHRATGAQRAGQARPRQDEPSQIESVKRDRPLAKLQLRPHVEQGERAQPAAASFDAAPAWEGHANCRRVSNGTQRANARTLATSLLWSPGHSTSSTAARSSMMCAALIGVAPATSRASA